MRKLILAATIAAFGTGMVLPAASVVTSDVAFAAQKKKSAKKGTKSAKKATKKPKKVTSSPEAVGG